MRSAVADASRKSSYLVDQRHPWEQRCQTYALQGRKPYSSQHTCVASGRGEVGSERPRGERGENLHLSQVTEHNSKGMTKL